MKNTLTIIFSIILFISCTNQKHDNQMPTDFSFKIIYETYSYDSKTGIYIRNYMREDSIVKVALTQKEMNIIYELFKKNDFWSFPNKFECDKNSVCTLPAFDTTIEITCNGKNKTVTNTTYCDKKIEQKKSDEFDEFDTEIMKIINNKPEIKNMRDCDRRFM